MGYDVSFHPISPEEMQEWYFTNALAKKSQRLAAGTSKAAGYAGGS